MSQLMQGNVKWFNNAKGFGFIEHETGQDVFVHYSVIQTDGFKTLKDGEIVHYELAEGTKGLHAAKVYRLKETAKGEELSTTDPISSLAIEVDSQPNKTSIAQTTDTARDLRTEESA